MNFLGILISALQEAFLQAKPPCAWVSLKQVMLSAAVASNKSYRCLEGKTSKLKPGKST